VNGRPLAWELKDDNYKIKKERWDLYEMSASTQIILLKRAHERRAMGTFCLLRKM